MSLSDQSLFVSQPESAAPSTSLGADSSGDLLQENNSGSGQDSASELGFV